MPKPDHRWLLDALDDPANGWSVGTFGAIAEFVRDAEEPVRLSRGQDRSEAATPRGAIRLSPNAHIVPVAYESPNRDGETWSHAVALCLPAEACAMSGRTALTELGPDRDAIRPEDRGAVLFDMGLGTLQVDVCIRTADLDLLACLRENAGRALAEPGNPAMGAIVKAGPNRVFVSRIGRAEVYQPIPPPDGVSPDGPHTHVLPKLLRAKRTHAATTPIPDGLVPCAHLFPPSPIKDPMGRRKDFDADAHARFQALFAKFGRPEAIALKHDLARLAAAGEEPTDLAAGAGKHARGHLRVALRQLCVEHPDDPRLRHWQEQLDRQPREIDDEDEEQPAHA